MILAFYLLKVLHKVLTSRIIVAFVRAATVVNVALVYVRARFIALVIRSITGMTAALDTSGLVINTSEYKLCIILKGTV